MPTLSVVKRHILELLAREPHLAEEIRAILPPPPKTTRKAASKTAADPVLSAIAQDAAKPAAVEPTEPVAEAKPDQLDVSTFDQEPGSVTVDGKMPSEAVAPDVAEPAAN